MNFGTATTTEVIELSSRAEQEDDDDDYFRLLNVAVAGEYLSAGRSSFRVSRDFEYLESIMKGDSFELCAIISPM